MKSFFRTLIQFLTFHSLVVIFLFFFISYLFRHLTPLGNIYLFIDYSSVLLDIFYIIVAIFSLVFIEISEQFFKLIFVIDFF